MVFLNRDFIHTSPHAYAQTDMSAEAAKFVIEQIDMIRQNIEGMKDKVLDRKGLDANVLNGIGIAMAALSPFPELVAERVKYAERESAARQRGYAFAERFPRASEWLVTNLAND